jgi:hypothetical protein
MTESGQKPAETMFFWGYFVGSQDDMHNRADNAA